MYRHNQLKNAIKNGDHKEIRRLLKNNEADIYHGKSRDEGVMHDVANFFSTHDRKSETFKQTIDVLLEWGADLEDVNQSLETPLHLATLCDTPELVKVLVSKGANLTALNDRGETPFIVCALLGQAEMMEALIDLGFDIDETDKKGVTALGNALDVACRARKEAERLSEFPPSSQLVSLIRTQEKECQRALKVAKVLAQRGAVKTGFFAVMGGAVTWQEVACNNGWVDLY